MTLQIFKVFYIQFYQMDPGYSQLNYYARFGSSIQTNMEGKAKNVFVVPKSEQGINLRCKTSDLSFARKYLPLIKGWVVGA